VHRRLFAVVALALAIAALVPAAAMALSVHVRVEGPSATVFGAKEPLLTPFTGSLPVEGGDPVMLSQPTPLGALQSASAAGGFSYRLTAASFGPYVSAIAGHAAAGSSGWVYKVNGVVPPVGADVSVLKQGDRVLWYWATFGEAGGPPTLDLVRTGRRCFRVFSVNDEGKRTPAGRVVFRLDGRRIASRSGRLCPVGRWSTLRATKAGAIRSQVLTRR
jgi:hypothetical protein